MDNQQQANEELRAKTLEALAWAFGHASDLTSEDLIRVLCYHCGIAFELVEKEFLRNYDPSPYCIAGHKTKASCDCGPIADND